MQKIWAKRALTPAGWQDSVAVEIGDDGRIKNVSVGVDPVSGSEHVACLLPAPANAHSHAFQRAMAGLTEQRGNDPTDSFWSWRRLMFRFLDALTPDHVQAIAAYVQMEMLEAGYATNVEFHYLHHAQGGEHYDELAEMVHRIVEAATQTGVGLTLLPVLYQYGGLDQRPLAKGQDRFQNDLEGFVRLAEASDKLVNAGAADWKSGVAPHSLRAVAPDDLKQIARLFPGKPLHMHLAEQIPEVEEVVDALKKRPVEWVLANLSPDENWHFIHLTQMQPHETKALAQSGATAVLCPITESSLGDGIFDGLGWFDAGGRIAIGSDSNIRISLSEELRTLDYSQRLRDNSRAALATAKLSTGRRLFDAICIGGAASAARDTGAIATGNWADLLVLDTNHVDLAELEGDKIIDSYVFAGDDRMVTDVWAAGRHVVREGRHVERESIEANYRHAVKQLREDY